MENLECLKRLCYHAGEAMIEDFEVFTGTARPAPGQPTVTIQRKGVLSMTAATYELLGSPPTVELLYSKSRNTIGIRPADPSLPHAIRVRKQSVSNTYLIAGQAFTATYGLRHPEARRYPAKLEGKILLIDLNSGWEEARSNRTRRPEQADAEHESVSPAQ